MRDTSASAQARAIGGGMRSVFAIGAGLVSAAAMQLYFLTGHTGHWFAWTIGTPLTAAFLGAFYWTAFVLAVQSARQPFWARARVGVLGVFVFVTLTFVLTVMHLDKFHFHSTDTVARGAAYLWFGIYLVDAPLVALAYLFQRRARGVDPPRQFLLPAWYRWVLAAQAAFFLLIGLLMFVSPDGASRFWPWALTPLTSRAMSAWIVGLGLVVAQAVWENAWERIEIAITSYAVLATLQFIAMLRYPGAMDWHGVSAWMYASVLASVLLLAAYGLFASRVARRGSPARP